MATASVKHTPQYKIHPGQFTLWVFLVSVTMLFAGFTSAYIVRKGEGNWVNFDLPEVFTTSLILVLVSSLTMALAQIAQKRESFGLSKLFVGITFLLGIGFVMAQLQGWSQLNTEQGVFLVGNASGGFLFIISGLHLAHIIGGIIALVVLLIKLFVSQGKGVSTSLTSSAIYWHFVGLLWVYLFLFFKFV